MMRNVITIDESESEGDEMSKEAQGQKWNQIIEVKQQSEDSEEEGHRDSSRLNLEVAQREEECSSSSKSIGEEEYHPQSESSENTIRYKRYTLRVRDLQSICEDEFYKKGKYSGIHKIKIDAQQKYNQKLEEMVQSNPNALKTLLKQKKEEFLQSKHKAPSTHQSNFPAKQGKFIFKSDRIKLNTSLRDHHSKLE